MKELESLQGIRSGDDMPVPLANMDVDVNTNGEHIKANQLKK
jgi:hypothetical protein